MEHEPTFLKPEEQTKSLDAVLGSIMSGEEYAEVEHATPYIFTLESGGVGLHYFGTPHMSDPGSPLFNEIEVVFQEANPDVVFVEGIQEPEDKPALNEHIKSVTRKEAIELGGESVFTLKLAVDRGIEWRCPEPTDSALYEHLLAKGFSRDEIFAWEAFHILPQYHRQMKREGFGGYVGPFLRRFERVTGWEGFDYSYERAIGIGERIFGEGVDVENDPDASDRIDPIPWEEKKEKQTVLNRISAASSAFRDRKIIEGIAEAKKTYKRIFIVYGASHAVMQEPALRKLFS